MLSNMNNNFEKIIFRYEPLEERLDEELEQYKKRLDEELEQQQKRSDATTKKIG